MEHLRSTKASVADLQDVQDLLHTKAGIKDVNATLKQASPLTSLDLNAEIALPARDWTLAGPEHMHVYIADICVGVTAL